MGESVAEATVTSWLKNEGDFVELEEGIIEIATDKVDSEVPSDYEGTLVKKLFKEGDIVKIGAPYAIIEIEGEVNKEESKVPLTNSAYDEPTSNDNTKTETNPLKSNEVTTPTTKGVNKFYSPLVKSIARKENIEPHELTQVKGTGREGRITKKDILKYIETH